MTGFPIARIAADGIYIDGVKLPGIVAREAYVKATPDMPLVLTVDFFVDSVATFELVVATGLEAMESLPLDPKPYVCTGERCPFPRHDFGGRETRFAPRTGYEQSEEAYK